MDGLMDLGVFPLDLVLVPGERIPLHLFEPRYRQLFADCVLGDREFVVARDHDDEVAQVGCTARFDELLQRSDDGRLSVIVVGGAVVELVEETEGNLYMSALCRTLTDTPVALDADLASGVRARFAKLALEVTGESREPDPEDGVPLSYTVAGAVEMADELKQGLLEERDENRRLADTLAALDEALRVADRTRVAAERAKTNGKVSH